MQFAELRNPFCRIAKSILQNCNTYTRYKPDINQIENTDRKPDDIDSVKKPKKAKLL